ncbi:hypothetical protein BC827DRAFT_1211740 [Russula dissimulans]|nr:hypothetical protein BC827DRAFT_1211740 [Russula dissimulans]
MTGLSSNRALSSITSRRSDLARADPDRSPKAREKFEQASGVEHAHFEPISGRLIEEKIVKQFRGQMTDEGCVKELIVQLEDKLDIRCYFMQAEVSFWRSPSLIYSLYQILAWSLGISDGT